MVPGPKKSPSAPAGKRNWLREVIGWVCVHEAFKQKAVALERLLTGVGKAERSGMKVIAGIIAIEEVKEFHERLQRVAFANRERPRDAQIDLRIRGASKLIERGFHSIDHRARALWRGHGIRASRLKLHQRGKLKAAGYQRMFPQAQSGCAHLHRKGRNLPAQRDSRYRRHR